MSKIKTFTWDDPDTLEFTTTSEKRKCKTHNFLAGGHKFFMQNIGKLDAKKTDNYNENGAKYF